MQASRRVILAAYVATAGLLIGCGEDATILNPSFRNYLTGGVVPLAPGAASSFVLVRVNNRTDQNIEFVVTVERQVEATADEAEVVGGAEPDEVLIVTETETFRLLTLPIPSANDVGILLDCPVDRVGLGEELDRPTESSGLFIGATEGGGAAGFGVPGNVNPLDATAGNFACGDTLIFEASTRAGSVGNVEVKSFLLSAADQPTEVTGPDTFNNARLLLETYRAEEE